MRFLSFAASLILLVPVASAQTSPPEADEETVELSPFVVSADDDDGYMARETLAGSRFKSSLNDIASQVTVMTSELLEDLGVVDLEQALSYSLNTESSFDTADTTNGQNTGNDLVGDPIFGGGGNTRGLGRSNRTHDFFDTRVKIDAYNTQRFTFSSGPNAILFGNSSPAGTIDTTYKRARTDRQKYIASLRLDSEGGWRGTLDVNQPIVKDRLSVRLIGMKEDLSRWRDPGSRDQERFFGTMTVKFTPKISVRGWFERAQTDEIPYRNIIVKDAVSRWVDAGMPDYDNGPGSSAPSNDPVFENNGSGKLSGTQYVYGYSDQGLMYDFGPIPVFAQTKPVDDDATLTDSSIFPYEVAISGNGMHRKYDSTIMGGVAEINPVKNLFFEFGMNREEFDYRYIDFLNYTDSELRVDANRYLPDQVTPNTHFGRYYVDHAMTGGNVQSQIDEWRAAVSYELDFTGNEGWSSFLGRHRAALLFTGSETEYRTQNADRASVVEDVPNLPGNIYDERTNLARSIYLRNYLGDPQRPEVGGAYWIDLPFDPMVDGAFSMPGTDLTATLFGGEEYGSRAAVAGNNADMNSLVYAMQSFFWDDRIVFNYGSRRDTIDIYDVIPNSEQQRITDAPNSGYWTLDQVDAAGLDYRVFANSEEPTTNLFGVVVHPVPWLSLFYNNSDTNATTGTVIKSLNGSDPAMSDGKGEEYGIGIRFLDNRFTLRLTRYENSAIGAQSRFRGNIRGVGLRQGSGRENLRRNVYYLERSALALGAPISERFRFYDEQLLEIDAAENGFATVVSGLPFDVLADRDAEGYEVTLSGNPFRGFTFVASFAQNETIESNIGLEWMELINERLPIWAQYLDESLTMYPNMTFADFLEATTQHWNYMLWSNGSPNPQERKYRANATAKYTFTEGTLKNFSFGGSFRWTSGAAVGFPVIDQTDNPFLIPGLDERIARTPDFENPYYGNSISRFDAFLGYRRKVFDDKFEWNVRLNIYNLQGKEFRVQSVNPDGEVVHVSVTEPTQFVLTNTFSF